MVVENKGDTNTAVVEPGQEPPTGTSQEPAPDATGDLVIDGATYTQAQTQNLLKKLRGESQTLRDRAKKAEASRDALKASQDEASNAVLAEQGKFKELYETGQATHTAAMSKVNRVLTMSAVKSGLKANGVPDALVDMLSISTEGLTVDPDTFMVQGDLAGVVNGYMEGLKGHIPATTDTPATTPATPPTQPTTVITEHRSSATPPKEPMKIENLGKALGDRLVKDGMSDGKIPIFGRS